MRARFYGVMVSTLDFESSDPSSNLGRTYYLLSIQFVPHVNNRIVLHEIIGSIYVYVCVCLCKKRKAPGGFEPPTSSLLDWRSNRLSYRAAN